MISSIKLFYLEGAAMVALYGDGQESSDDWLCNLPAGEVILGEPVSLPIEQAVPVSTASQLVAFTPAFRRRLQPKRPVLRAPQLGVCRP
jgi:hypothetical protein